MTVGSSQCVQCKKGYSLSNGNCNAIPGIPINARKDEGAQIGANTTGTINDLIQEGVLINQKQDDVLNSMGGADVLGGDPVPMETVDQGAFLPVVVSDDSMTDKGEVSLQP